MPRRGVGFETPTKRDEELNEWLSTLERKLENLRNSTDLHFTITKAQLKRHNELLAIIAQGLQRSGGFSAEDIGKLIRETEQARYPWES